MVAVKDGESKCLVAVNVEGFDFKCLVPPFADQNVPVAKARQATVFRVYCTS